VNKQIQVLRLARYFIIYGYKHNLFLKKLIKEWDDPKDIITRCAQMQVNMNNNYMVAITVIVKMLTLHCKHPKKYRDKTSDGISYCMNCNSDL